MAIKVNKKVNKERQAIDDQAIGKPIYTHPSMVNVKNTREETLRQQGLARIAGNVPLPPETQLERNIKEAAIQKLVSPPIQPIQTPIKEEIMQSQPSNQEITAQEQPNKGFLEKTFNPSVEEANKRRMETFGTTSTAPVVATAAIGGLLGGEALALGGVTLLEGGAAAAIPKISQAVLANFKGKRLLVTLGGGGYVGKIFIGRQLATQQSILTQSLSVMGDANAAVKSGEMSYSDALNIHLEQISAISQAERDIKWITQNKIINYLSGGKDTQKKFLDARDILIPILKRELDTNYQAFQAAQINQARATYGR